MHHGPAPDQGPDNASAFKARLGLVLFIIYGLVYLGFVVLNTLTPKLMSEKIIFGLNLAVVYGFALIAIAVNLGLIYNAICTRYEKRLNTPEDDPQ